MIREPFGILEWTVDASTGRIFSDHQETRLEPRIMDVLVYLASRANELVTRQELEDNVWSDVVVSYETLTSTIRKLRLSLNDDARNPRILETIPKKGYRLIAPVELGQDQKKEQRTDPASALNAPQVLWHKPFFGGIILLSILLAALTGYWYVNHDSKTLDSNLKTETATSANDKVTPIADKPRIAVLPFRNMSSDPEQEYFSDGLTEDLITDMSKIFGLSVIAQYSSFSFKTQQPDIAEISGRLGVSHIIEGSVRKAGDVIRITVQLVDASSGKHIWAERYDRNLADVFAIQDEVVGHITRALSLRLTPQEKQRLAFRGTDNLQAYDAYMKGRQQEGFFNQESLLEAQVFFTRAIELDPEYAEPYARLAQIHSLRAQFNWVEDEIKVYQKSLQLAEKAVALNPSLPFAHWGLAQTLSRPAFRQYERAIKELELAIAIDPDYADAYASLGLYHAFIGQAEKTASYVEKAMQINPIPPSWYHHALGVSNYALKDYEAAAKEFAVASNKNPAIVFIRHWYAAALAMAGRIEDAQWQRDELIILGYERPLKEMIEHAVVAYPEYRNRYLEGLRKAGFN
jgi:TolB-like protein/DNA-binding winged helix-turn-helix (wHTH) protein/Tfp pilus assembly protein PilF